MAKQAKKKGKISFKTTLLLYALIPLFTAIIVVGVSSVILMINNLEEQTLEELHVAADGLKEYYEYDLVHGNDLVDGWIEYAPEEYVDKVKDNTDVDLTVFKDNIRFVTTLRKDDGSRNEGSKAGDEVWAAVKDGNDFTSTNVEIGGKRYFVYYLPMHDSNGKVVGMAFAGKSAERVQSAETNLMIIIGIAAGVLILIFVILALLIANKISRPVVETANNVKKLSEGDVTVRFDSATNIKETSMLIASADDLTVTLHGIVEKIHQAMDSLYSLVGTTADQSSEVASSTTQISDALNGLSDSTVQMAESVQDINTNIMDMGEIVESAQTTVRGLTESSKNMEHSNNAALKCINDIAEGSQQSVVAVDSIAESIKNTNEAVNKISEMVDLITSIASQTNLLALNASIEAARAGEAGKGFAVVADNIKDLASQSDESANEIKVIAEEISALSNTCVHQADDVKELIQNEQKLLSQAKGQFDALDGEIVSSVDNITTVDEITGQLGDIKDTVVNAVSDLSAISEETSATNEEITANTDMVATNVGSTSNNMKDIHSLANGLKEAISFFKL